MPDIDKIIERLLGDRRIREGAAFSSRSYSDQPLIEKGSDLKARMERRNAERAARHNRDARTRRSEGKRQEGRVSGHSTTPQASNNVQTNSSMARSSSTLQGFGQWVRSLDLESQVSRTVGGLKLEPTPAPIREMRKLEGQGVPDSLAYGSGAAASLFYRQALLMEHYTDDYEFHGTFLQYYPTYAAMSDQQLRGYFAWRTRVREGHVGPAPLSFAFVYVYELLAGIGTTAGSEALEDLRAFGHAYQHVDELQGIRLNNYLHRWTADYAIYYGLTEALHRGPADGLGDAVLTLLTAEHAQLRAEGRQPRIPNEAASGPAPSPQQLFEALGNASTYHIAESRLAKDEPELLRATACDVFSALVSHCSKRRKTDYIEGLFGYASRTPYTMFSAAVFYEPKPHPDTTVKVSEAESYVCKDGRWSHVQACDARARNAELGLAMHAADHILRDELGYAYPLKEREIPKYLQKIVHDAVTRRLAERAEAERRRISIDLTKLSSIRAAAAVTQEALLTDEERDEEVVSAQPHNESEALPDAQDAEAVCPQQQSASTTEQQPTTATEQQRAADTTQDGLLTSAEAQFLTGLLEGRSTSELVSTLGQFPSVVADSINEKLFDLVGDAVIEFDGDEARIIEDYLEDVREVLQS